MKSASRSSNGQHVSDVDARYMSCDKSRVIEEVEGFKFLEVGSGRFSGGDK